MNTQPKQICEMVPDKNETAKCGTKRPKPQNISPTEPIFMCAREAGFSI